MPGSPEFRVVDLGLKAQLSFRILPSGLSAGSGYKLQGHNSLNALLGLRMQGSLLFGLLMLRRDQLNLSLDCEAMISPVTNRTLL